MSGEQITSKEFNKMSKVATFEKSHDKKVNINELLSKVREEKNKEKKENYIFLGLICGMVAVTGIIASL
tara:strand:- start:50 stop:256 length:207 start_codon:yes stop_codon:yes gene_type:complete